MEQVAWWQRALRGFGGGIASDSAGADPERHRGLALAAVPFAMAAGLAVGTLLDDGLRAIADAEFYAAARGASRAAGVEMEVPRLDRTVLPQKVHMAAGIPNWDAVMKNEPVHQAWVDGVLGVDHLEVLAGQMGASFRDLPVARVARGFGQALHLILSEPVEIQGHADVGDHVSAPGIATAVLVTPGLPGRPGAEQDATPEGVRNGPAASRAREAWFQLADGALLHVSEASWRPLDLDVPAAAEVSDPGARGTPIRR